MLAAVKPVPVMARRVCTVALGLVEKPATSEKEQAATPPVLLLRSVPTAAPHHWVVFA